MSQQLHYRTNERLPASKILLATVAPRLENLRLSRAVDGALTCILGREACLRHGLLTIDELLKENKRIEADLTGLKD